MYTLASLIARTAKITWTAVRTEKRDGAKGLASSTRYIPMPAAKRTGRGGSRGRCMGICNSSPPAAMVRATDIGTALEKQALRMNQTSRSAAGNRAHKSRHTSRRSGSSDAQIEDFLCEGIDVGVGHAAGIAHR